MKMTVADELKIIDNKIKASKSGSIRCRQISSQIDRQIKASVKSTNELAKCEYMTGEGLGQKQAQMNKLNLIILHWVMFLTKD